MLSTRPELVNDPCVARSLELPDTHAAALREVARRLGGPGVRWAVTGSAGHRLQGVPVDVHDLDIQTDEPGAWMAHETLADVAVQRLTRWKSTTMSSLLGRYRIADIDVEIIGDIRHRASQEPPWDEPVHASISWMPTSPASSRSATCSSASGRPRQHRPAAVQVPHLARCDARAHDPRRRRLHPHQQAGAGPLRARGPQGAHWAAWSSAPNGSGDAVVTARIPGCTTEWYEGPAETRHLAAVLLAQC